MTPQLIPYRAEFKQESGPLKLFTSGKTFSFGTSTFSNTNSPVLEARSDHLLWVSGVEKPSIPRSTTKPRILPSSSLAQTTAMSAIGELVIHILAPFNT